MGRHGGDLVCRTCSQSAISTLSFEMRFTRSLRVWTACDGWRYAWSQLRLATRCQSTRATRITHQTRGGKRASRHHRARAPAAGGKAPPGGKQAYQHRRILRRRGLSSHCDGQQALRRRRVDNWEGLSSRRHGSLVRGVLIFGGKIKKRVAG